MCCYAFPITMRSELLLFLGICAIILFAKFPAVHSMSGSSANSCPELRAVNHYHMLASPPNLMLGSFLQDNTVRSLAAHTF